MGGSVGLPIVYDLHILGTDTEPDERYEYDDAAAATIGFYRLACKRKRRGVLSKSGHLPDFGADIIASYIPSDDDAAVSRAVSSRIDNSWVEKRERPIMVTLGDPQPAFPREQAAREDADETPEQQRQRRMQNELEQAAYWYAKGFIDCVGGLSPYSNDDAAAFSIWHAETAQAAWMSGREVLGITDQWATWSAKRREETGR